MYIPALWWIPVMYIPAMMDQVMYIPAMVDPSNVHPSNGGSRDVHTSYGRSSYVHTSYGGSSDVHLSCEFNIDSMEHFKRKPLICRFYLDPLRLWENTRFEEAESF